MTHPSVHRLRRWLDAVPQAIVDFSKAELEYKPAQDKWSKKEILGHLCDSALHNWQRFNAAYEAEGPLVTSTYRQDDLVRQNRYQAQTTGQILNLWISLNQQIATVLEGMPKEKWAIEVVGNWPPDWTVDRMATDYVDHLEHHLRQLFGPDIQHFQAAGRWHISAGAALEKLQGEGKGKPFIKVMSHRTMSAEVFAPQGLDTQSPHEQDELYVIISGTGEFVRGSEKIPVQPGDLLFVPARVPHRFEGFEGDFRVWVVFY